MRDFEKMKFYDIDNSISEAINTADKPVRLKVEIELDGHFQSIFEKDIIEANFYSLKEAAGGVSSRGEILIDNACDFFSTCGGTGAGLQVKVSFSLGEGLPFFNRFIYYINDKGIQEIKGSGRKKSVLLVLRDLSYKLRKSDESRDWTYPAVFTYSVVCDKSQPDKSLVHGIAKRAGLTVNDIDCSTIHVTLPFVRLRKNIWTELSNLATAYRCHLECAPEKPLVFAHSPYQINEQLEENNEQNTDNTYLIKGDAIFYLRKAQRADYYRNTVRLKVNMPVSLDIQEIWRYNDPPVFYDDNLQAHFPFKNSLTREIETGKYEGKYRVIDESGKERNVVFADDIDTKEEAENRLEYKNEQLAMRNEQIEESKEQSTEENHKYDFEKALYYSFYDTTSYFDRAVLTLKKEADCDLYKAVIFGKPIVLDLNRSCFMRDDEGISNYGTAALNITGSYFSEYEINGSPHYEDWVSRELAERVQNKREFTIKTHRALFNARVGANLKLEMRNEKLEGKIRELSFRYRKDKAFVTVFKLNEE
jgi:hypothetical protein